MPRREPRHVNDVTDHDRRHHRTGAVHVDQARARRRDGDSHATFDRGDVAVDADDVVEQLERLGFAFGGHSGVGMDRRQQLSGSFGRQSPS